MPHALDSRKRWIAFAVVCIGTLMIVLDTTIVNVALPSIRADLGFSETSLVWVVNAYLLTFGRFLVRGGSVRDVFGDRRRLRLVPALFPLARGISVPSECPVGLIGDDIAAFAK